MPTSTEPILSSRRMRSAFFQVKAWMHSSRVNLAPSGAEIIVEDNGTGFDPSDESKPHTTLINIRQRLKMMCGADMIIESREGGGTAVKLMIPCTISEHLNDSSF